MNSELLNMDDGHRRQEMCTREIEGWGTDSDNSAEPIYCDHCHKEITGIYMFAAGGMFCSNDCVGEYLKGKKAGA